MMWSVCIGALAAFGVLAVLWCLTGFFLPGTGTVLLLPEGARGIGRIRRLLWLRDLGVLKGAVLVPEGSYSEAERMWLYSRGIEICSREEILTRLGMGESDFDGTGNGDPAGYDWRGCLPEL